MSVLYLFEIGSEATKAACGMGFKEVTAMR